MKTPYVGITGFTNKEDALNVLGAASPHSRRLVMVGVLASLKTMRGMQNSRPNRYPAVDAIAHIFPNDQRALNLIHYNTKELDTLVGQLLIMTAYGGNNVHGFQLNIPWPSLEDLRVYKDKCPDMQIVLQVGSRALDMVVNSPEILVERVAEYETLVDYVLLDPSGGLGIPLDPKLLREYLLALYEKRLNIGLGVAGGLSPATLDLVKPLAREFRGLSIDAEGRLRTKEDHLDCSLAKEYLQKALAVV